MKTLLSLLCLVFATFAHAADVAAARTALRAELDRARAWARPNHDLFQTDKKRRPTEQTVELHQRRADALFRAAWTVADNGAAQVSLAALLGTATRNDQTANDALLYLIRVPDARAPLREALRRYIQALAAGDYRAWRMPAEKALAIVNDIDRGVNTPSVDWGRTFGELLRALR